MLQERLSEPTSAAAERLTFDEARDRYLSLIYAFVSRRIRPIEEAQDLTAQVFVDAFRRWRHVRGEAKFYLLGIARNKVRQAIRKHKPLLRLEEGDLASSGMDAFVTKAEAAMALRVVLRLPEAEREAILLQTLEDLSAEEIAQVLGRSVKATNSLLQRARGRIRKMLAESTSEVTL